MYAIAKESKFSGDIITYSSACSMETFEILINHVGDLYSFHFFSLVIYASGDSHK